MTSTNMILKRHLSNIIYIENHFGLDLFKTNYNLESVDGEDDKIGILSRKRVDLKVGFDERSAGLTEESELGLETFFRALQDFSSELNILPYYYDKEKFWGDIESIKEKLANYPLIIIDWQLETSNEGKTGMDVFEKIIEGNEILHYYVIYSNEVDIAVEAFSNKYKNINMGEIAKNKVAVINDNAIILFCDKQTNNIINVIEKFVYFTENTYGYLPQIFLDVKQQIENKTAMLYNEFMELDSMMLPQLIGDEVYKYKGFQEEVLVSIVMNKLRNEIRIINEEKSYIQSVIDKFMEKDILKEDFERAYEIVNKKLNNFTFELFVERYKKIKEDGCLKNADYYGLKKAAEIFYNCGKIEGYNTITDRIQKFVLFLSICNDKDYLNKYVKLLMLIKMTEYSSTNQWSIKECSKEENAVEMCQGDIFIDDDNNYLLCVSPSCQIMRPDKIKNTYTFLKGTVGENEYQDNQKIGYSMNLVNKNKDKVILINWEFYSPVVLDFSKKEELTKYEKYQRCYRLNMEYTYKVVELYSEYIKQIGVEELYIKRIDENKFFCEKKGEK